MHSGTFPSTAYEPASEPAHRSSATILPGARLIDPLWHPERCLGLSGLYAIINAIQLALAAHRRLMPSELDLLIRAGLRFLNGRLSPEQALVCGMRVTLWRALAEALLSATYARTGVRVTTERILITESGSRSAAIEGLEQALTRLRVPMILCRGGRYTVVRGFTRSSLLLLDSSGACWMTKDACGVPGDLVGSRHVFYPSSFLALNA